MAQNSICHIEISGSDARKASEFYKNLFGWTIDLSMGEEYIFFQPEEGVSGAFSKNENHSPGSSVIFYVQVDDIEAFLKKAAELGGKETVPKTEIPGHGWYGHFTDPDNNVMGLYTALPKE